MYGVIVLAVWRTKYKLIPFLLAFDWYLIAFCGVVHFGLALKYIIPVVPLLFFSVILSAVVFAFSEFGRRIAIGNSLAVLIGFQAFRLPLELLLHHWAGLGTIPSTMTWTGQNKDVYAGIISLLAIPFVNSIRPVAWFAQIFGFLLLLNVIYTVAMSSPFPFAWGLESPIQLIFHLPYALIAPLFVGAALAGHLITFRALRSSK